jgi:hypothetical protein
VSYPRHQEIQYRGTPVYTEAQGETGLRVEYNCGLVLAWEAWTPGRGWPFEKASVVEKCQTKTRR